jgi:hypothetical protein
VADIVRSKHHRPIAEEPFYSIDFVEMEPDAIWRIRNLAAADIRSHSFLPFFEPAACFDADPLLEYDCRAA